MSVPISETPEFKALVADRGKSTSPTAARPQSSDSSHWYSVLGQPMHEVPRADGSGMRPTTLADARRRNLLPSCTQILRILDKPALNAWKTENAVLACLTTPRLPGEDDDAYVYRVLHTEKVQDQEAKSAADLGTRIHNALAALFMGQPFDRTLADWVAPAYSALQNKKECLFRTEFVVVGEGYAGRCDLCQTYPDHIELWDFKSTKKPPKSTWPEHRMQLAAYAHAHAPTDPAGRPVITGNVYISTFNKGEFVICRHDEWQETYWNGFRNCLRLWQFINDYRPNQPEYEHPH